MSPSTTVGVIGFRRPYKIKHQDHLWSLYISYRYSTITFNKTLVFISHIILHTKKNYISGFRERGTPFDEIVKNIFMTP